MDENIPKKSKGLKYKILVPILILIGLAIVWMIKNPLKRERAASENTSAENNEDFELNITKEVDLEKLKSYGIPIVIDFGSDSCIPCKKMAPVLEKLNKDLKGKAIIRFADVWKYPDLAKDFPISLIPTQVLIDKNGKPYVPSEANSAGITMYNSKDTNEHVFTTHEGGITEEELLSILKEMGLEE